jgi:FeS assembly protein IscX
MPVLKWTDADQIGFELNEKFPDLDPLSVRFTDMHKLVAELSDFADDPNASSEGVLEAIQMAWLEYSREE